MSKFLFHILIEKEPDEKEYSSICLENNVASQGKTSKEAFENIREAVSLYVDHVIKDARYEMLWRPASKEEWEKFFDKRKRSSAKIHDLELTA